MNKLMFRQIHLDFHTSEKIAGVAEDFDAEAFAGALAKANVNSVTCFARCHHGWLYYNSRKFKSIIHPKLKNVNLLNEQIEACHKHGIKVPIYLTVQWDHRLSSQRLDWVVLDENGNPHRSGRGSTPYKPGFYTALCVNTPYFEFLKDNVRDIFESVENVDGLFFDIVQPVDCSCYYCRKEMIENGIDPSVGEERIKFALQVVHRFKRRMTEYVREFSKDCSIFYNAGHISPGYREIVDAYTHFELESLPSGQWGYMHFPVTARYARNMGLDCLGMTGKFHTIWGDFHSFKNKAALDYECFRNLAFNCKCSIGDQLHPRGTLCDKTYNIIGKVYSSVKDKEPWCESAVPVTEIGVMTTEKFSASGFAGIPRELYGASRMLQELSCQFDIIDEHCDLEKYKLIVLPDFYELSKTAKAKLSKFLAKGHSVIASYKSAFDKGLNDFALDFGIENVSEPEFSVDFIKPDSAFCKSLDEIEYVMYQGGMKVKKIKGDTLAFGIAPYFERTYESFCSHLHAPSSGNAFSDAIVKNNNSIYFAHPVFSIYHEFAPLWCKTMVNRAIEMLLPQRLISHNGPSTLITTINSQPQKNRWVLHVLNYIEQRRSASLDIIEDVIPLYETEFIVAAPKPVKSLKLVPEGKSLDFEEDCDILKFNIPVIRGHEMVELQF